MIFYEYQITHKGKTVCHSTARAAAETMVNLWFNLGPDLDIRVDRRMPDGEIKPIDFMDRFAIETQMRKIALQRGGG
jgi:hypothetical protein